MTYTPITSNQVDAESPIDDLLMETIKDNFADHEARLLLLKSYPITWQVNGLIDQLKPTVPRPSSDLSTRRLDGLRQVTAQSFTQCNFSVEYPGTSGTLEIDIRKYRAVNHLVTSILSQFSGSLTSVAQIAPALATQSIARATAQISTQSVALFKSAINISSIVSLGSDYWRYNLASAPDSDWKETDTVTFASCSNAANDGSFTIVRVNDDGGNNIVVYNASGVAQTSAAGNCTLRAYIYAFTNPVSSEFVVGESAVFASHSSGGNNGTFPIYAVNSSGNNIIVKNASGVVQAGVAGNANVLRFVYAFSSAASATDFVVGESARMASHTSGVNNGDLRITAVNSGGNNVVVYNPSGATQGGAAGTVDTTRFIYALSSNPTSSFSVGHRFVATGTGDANNNGVFTVKEINRSGTNNLVVSNVNGGPTGALGTLYHTRKIISLSSDQSAIYNTRSLIELRNMPNTSHVGFFTVLEVNRGGGSNYNVVVDIPTTIEQINPAGRITTESKSLFSTRPSFTIPVSGENTNNNAVIQRQTVEAVFDGTDGTVSSAEAAVPVLLGLDVLSYPAGNPKNLTVQLL